MNTTLIPCQCYCHVLQVEDFRDEYPEVCLVVLYREGGNQRSLANRLRGAWKLLCGSSECIHEVVLDVDGVHQLKEALA